MVCLSEQTLFQLMQNELPPARRQAVEEHVDRCATCRRAIALLARGDSWCSGTDGLDAPAGVDEQPALVPGTMVDHFRIVQPLGQGGLGRVYLAQDTQLQRWVAVKILRAELCCEPAGAHRLLDEARATARLGHPNIVSIFYAGIYRGSPFLALEHVQGETLRQRMTRAPLSTDEVLQVSLAVAEGLQEAHRHGVLHCDLKPENIMLSVDGRPRIVDFGLAALVDPGRAGASGEAAGPDGGESGEAASSAANADPPAGSMTSHRRTLRGTPAYMAPEQWRGEATTPATDVWALGCVLYELISGSRPFTGSTVPSLRARVTDPRPATGVGGAGVFPEELRTLCDACLDKQPGRRPSLVQIAAALRELRAALGRRRGGALSYLMILGGTILGFVALIIFLGSISVAVEPNTAVNLVSCMVMTAWGVAQLAASAWLLIRGVQRSAATVFLIILGSVVTLFGALLLLSVTASGFKEQWALELMYTVALGVVPLVVGVLLILAGALNTARRPDRKTRGGGRVQHGKVVLG
jgi:serine/threonine protein kinase